MGFFSKVAQIYRNFGKPFNSPNELIFDDDFRLVLYFFRLFGFSPSTKSYLFGIAVFAFVPISYLLGELQDVIISFKVGNTQRFLISTTYSSFLISSTVQVLTFVLKERDILHLIKALQTLHQSEDEKPMSIYRTRCYQLVKYYTLYLIASMTMVVILTLSGYNIFKLATPTLFDDFAEGSFYVPLLIVNIIQMYIVALITSSSDLLHVLFMIRAGANFEMLSEKLRLCARSDETETNDKNLILCVVYHQNIIK